MPARRRSRKSSKRVYITCAVVTLIVLGVVFGIHKYKISQVAPVYQVHIDGLEATTPAEALIISALPPRARSTPAVRGCGRGSACCTS